jgi:hypothetical protein
MNTRKIGISFLLCLCIAVSSQAQDTLKATSGKWATELNLNLSDADFKFNNLVNQIKLRAFVSDRAALRMAFTIKNHKGEGEYKNSYGTNPVNNKSTQKSTLIGINFGAEGHLKGTRRLSPYLGGEFALGIKRTKEESTNNIYSSVTEGAWLTYETIETEYGQYTQTLYNEIGFTSFGLNGIAGFDFYLDKHFYVGYEFIYGFEYKKYQTVKTTYKAIDPLSGDSEYIPTNSGKSDAKEFSIGPNIINGIRIGFIF